MCYTEYNNTTRSKFDDPCNRVLSLPAMRATNDFAADRTGGIQFNRSIHLGPWSSWTLAQVPSGSGSGSGLARLATQRRWKERRGRLGVLVSQIRELPMPVQRGPQLLLYIVRAVPRAPSLSYSMPNYV